MALRKSTHQRQPAIITRAPKWSPALRQRPDSHALPPVLDYRSIQYAKNALIRHIKQPNGSAVFKNSPGVIFV